MKKILLNLLLIIPFALSAQSQLKGTVTDITGHPLDAVTLTLSQQNKTVSSAFADLGNFTLNYPGKGKYTLSATLVGYKPVTRMIDVPKDSVKIMMQPDSHELQVVTVSAAKPIIERKIDRVTFNVENSIIASGGTAWDALLKAPGVQTKFDGTLSANKKDVQIYMDGKPLNISGDNLTSYLQGLPSDLVSRIEVFSIPPAMFDAQGGSVINIITKKSKKQGLNMSLNGGYTQATFGSYTLSTVFNYRKDKINIYGNYGYSDKEMRRDQDDYVTYATPGNNSYWNSPGHTDSKSHTNNYKLGLDYQLSSNQVLGFLVTGNNRIGTTDSETPTTITNNFRPTPDSTLQTNGHTNRRGNRYAFNLNYNIKLDTSGKSLNVDLDYSPFRNTNSQYVDAQTYLPDGSFASSPYHIYTPSMQNINIYSGKVDYSYKIGKIWSLTSGLKYSSIQSDNIFSFYNTAGATPVFEADKSDNFKYTENTAAAYTSISGSLGKWTFEGGLRGELTHTKGVSLSLDSVNRNQYFKLFPTLFMGYKIDDNDELSFTYGYRIDRPEYNRLNPFKLYLSPYDYLVGNPALQPAFVQNFELSYTYAKQYTVTAYYTATHDMFSNITVQDNVKNLFYDTQQNLGLSLNTGLRLTAPIHPSDWWDMTTTVEGYYQQEKSAYLQGSYNYHKFSYDAYTTQSFTINKAMGLKAEISGTYTAQGIQGIFVGNANYDIDAGIKTNILNGQGTLKLAAGDIFFSNTYHIQVNYLNQNNGFYQRNDTQNISLSFTYRFGKNVAASRSRSTASDDEKRRAQ